MIPLKVADCLTCQHKIAIGRKCAAYEPGLVPQEIWSGKVTHRVLRGDEIKPLLYEKKNT